MEHPSTCSSEEVSKRVPLYYHPCFEFTEDLQPIMISKMRLEAHHRGTKVTVRVCAEPRRDEAVLVEIEDEDGSILWLELFNQPAEDVLPVKEYLPLGKVLIVKEPFYNCNDNGSKVLRVDHVSDVVYLDGTEEEVPSKWRREKVTGDSAMIRKEGDDAEMRESWAEAVRLYTSAIEQANSPEDRPLAYLDRSRVNRKLGRLEMALSDATAGNNILASVDGSFCAVRALYELGDFKGALEAFKVLNLENDEADKEMTRIGERMNEQQNGKYSFSDMYEQAKSTPPLIDCATFSGVVEVRDSPGRGRGLFTTKPVSAGELLVCEKAFGYHYANADKKPPNERANNASNAACLKTSLIEKIYHNPKMSRGFLELHGGILGTEEMAAADGTPVVDSFLVQGIMGQNAFASCRTSRALMNKLNPCLWPAQANDLDIGETSGGIWLLASRINHSCVANCARSFIGDMIIIHATKDLEENTELLWPYLPLSPGMKYQEVQDRLGRWKFTCTCELCGMRKETTDSALETRRRLLKDFQDRRDADRYSDDGINPHYAEKMFAKLEETYPKQEGRALREEFVDPCLVLGRHFLATKRPAYAVKIFVKCLQSLGFDIISAPLDTPPKLEIRRWGRCNSCLPSLFVKLSMAYVQTSPELCGIAVGYGMIAYRMIIGESETWSEAWPKLK